MSRRGGRDERGAVAIMVAMTMVVLLVAVAMVLDFGLVRIDRQVNKSAADSAAAAGTRALGARPADTSFHPYAGVCEALRYLQVNDPRFSGLTSASGTWTDASGNPAGGDGCDPGLATQTCVPGDQSTWARFTGTTTDGITARIQSGYRVDDGSFAVENLPALESDGSERGGCDQVAVIVSQTRSPGLGSVATDGDLTTRVRSVGRVTITPPENPVALLILEREDCQALLNTSGGAGGRIEVLGYQDHPGLIHVDSDGTGSGCNKPIIVGENEGTCPPADHDHVTGTNTCGGIVAYEAETGGTPGGITTVASSNQSDGISEVFAGPWPGTEPTQRDLVTRSVVDSFYLDGVEDAVDNAGLVFDAAADGTLDPATWTTVGCNPPSPVNDDKVLVDCNNFKNPATFNGTQVLFSGRVSADNLRLPKAERVYIVGSTSPAALSVDGFSMHDAGTGSCTGATDPSAERARLFIQNGPLKVSGGGSLVMCHTSVIMLGGDPDACLPAYAGPAPAPTTTPCPAGAGTGTLDFSGGADIDWTGPDTVAAGATQADHDDLEDLALWTETAGVHSVGGGGSVHLEGVFTAPNANPFKINGGGTQDVENSQYVVRKLETTGNGVLTMRPNPDDSVKLPRVSYSMVR